MIPIKGLLKRISVKTALQRILCQTTVPDYGSISINDRTIFESFVSDPNNTFLVSFPRAGSHWLRMLMELYFGRPSLVRVFYYPERNDYLTLHTHDLELDVERANVIYLYRDPVDTIYSQLCYYNEALDDRERITYWADLYGRHLDKWLYREQFTLHKTILTYEGMKRDLVTELSKVTQHFGEPIDNERLEIVAKQITKDEVKDKAEHDPQVVQLQESYEVVRGEFWKRHGTIIWDVVISGRPYLAEFFDPEILPRK